MVKRLSIFLVALFAFGFAVAGCGDDEEDSNTSGGGAAQTETQSSGGGASNGGGNSDAAKAAREGCEAGITNNAALDASKQKELTKECEKVADAAASGDKAKFKEAYGSYCDKLSEALPEQARAQAKQACQQSQDAIK
jgi:hypothetical protein